MIRRLIPNKLVGQRVFGLKAPLDVNELSQKCSLSANKAALLDHNSPVAFVGNDCERKTYWAVWALSRLLQSNPFEIAATNYHLGHKLFPRLPADLIVSHWCRGKPAPAQRCTK